MIIAVAIQNAVLAFVYGPMVANHFGAGFLVYGRCSYFGRILQNALLSEDETLAW